MNPASRRRSTFFHGYASVLSVSAAVRANSPCASSRARAWSAACSSVSGCIGFLSSSIGESGAPGREELAQHGAMAARLVLAIAAHGEVRLVRERGEEREVVLGLRALHLRAVLAHERAPLRRRARRQPQLHGLHARREIGKPYVVPVPRRELPLRHAARRTPHGPD